MDDDCCACFLGFGQAILQRACVATAHSNTLSLHVVRLRSLASFHLVRYEGDLLTMVH